MMKALAIDTSNYPLGIALAEDDQIIGEYITNIKKNHSVRVMPAIETLLRDCDVKASELDKIIVAKGPGSYTGVRIGVTIAKTLAWTLNIPLTGVSSLELIAANGKYFDGLISPLFDARRGQIYTGLYEIKDTEVLTVLPDTNILASEWAEHLKEYNRSVLFLGVDSHLHKEAIEKALDGQAIFASSALNIPRPGELALMGMNRPSEDTHSFVPNYVRMAEAEVNWLEKQKNK